MQDALARSSYQRSTNIPRWVRSWAGPETCGRPTAEEDALKTLQRRTAARPTALRWIAVDASFGSFFGRCFAWATSKAVHRRPERRWRPPARSARLVWATSHGGICPSYLVRWVAVARRWCRRSAWSVSVGSLPAGRRVRHAHGSKAMSPVLVLWNDVRCQARGISPTVSMERSGRQRESSSGTQA